MITYTINKNLEGHKNNDTFIRIFPSGWFDMHYIIEESIKGSHFGIKLLDNKELIIYLKGLEDSGVVKNADMVHYFACDIEKAEIHKDTNKLSNFRNF